ncbi:MAG TPA: hypothetical protein PKY51_08785 [Fimbriimonadaceae bacterium]|nr:hypothetical protein [Fimbriimonadaceae bacterium]
MGGGLEQKKLPGETIQHREDPRLATAFEAHRSEVDGPRLAGCSQWQDRLTLDAKLPAHLVSQTQTFRLPDAMHRLEVHARHERVDAPKSDP